MFGVERTGPGRIEAGANRPEAFDGAAEFETLDPNRCRGPCPAERMAHMFVRRVSTERLRSSSPAGAAGARARRASTSSSKLRSVTSCWVSGSSAIGESQSKRELSNGLRISCDDSANRGLTWFRRRGARWEATEP